MVAKFEKLLFILSACLLLQGCATIGSVNDTWQKRPERSQSKIFDYSVAEVYAASKAVVFELGLRINYECVKGKVNALYASTAKNVAIGFIKRIITPSTCGELVGIFVTPISDKQAKVDVVVQKKYKIDIDWYDYRGVILEQIGNYLAKDENSKKNLSLR